MKLFDGNYSMFRSLFPAAAHNSTPIAARPESKAAEALAQPSEPLDEMSGSLRDFVARMSQQALASQNRTTTPVKVIQKESSPRRGIDAERMPRIYQKSTAQNSEGVAEDDNACGTTSLAMVLSYFGKIPQEKRAGMLPKVDVAKARALDQEVRAWGKYSSPDDLIRGARSHGLNAECYNNSSLNELKQNLACNRPVMLMMPGPHWVVATSFESKPSNQGAMNEYITIVDPANGQSERIPSEMLEKDWEKPMSQSGEILNNLMNYRNCMIVLCRPPEELAPSRDFDIAYTQAIGSGVSGMANSGIKIGQAFTEGKPGKVVEGISGIVGGAISTLSGIPGTIGRLLEQTQIPVISHIGSGIKWIGNGIAKVGQAMGSVVGSIGEKIGTVVNKAWNGVKTVAQKIGNGIKKAADTVWNGVKSVASKVGNFFKNLFRL